MFNELVEKILNEDDKSEVMRSKMIDFLYDIGYFLAGEKEEDEVCVLEFRKGEDVIVIRLSLKEEEE